MAKQAMTDDEIFARIPAPPEGAKFVKQRMHRIRDPHPYCLTPSHVTYAAEHYGSMLDENVIRDAEKNSRASCGHHTQGKPYEKCILPYDQHKSELCLVVGVPQNKDLKAVPGLHAWLLSIKELATSLGIDGFAFPTK